MAVCSPIPQEKIRAEIWFGSTLVAKTPLVLSFNVTKSRSQISDTFSAQIEMLAGFNFPLGGDLQIRAGVKGNLKTIFTGKIKRVAISPSFGKPSYYRVSLDGGGVLTELENKKFSRRLRSDGQGMFCMITGGPENRVDAYYSLDGSKKAGGNKQEIKPSLDPSKTAAGENSPVILYNSLSSKDGTRLGSLSTDTKGTGSGGTGEGFRVHTHESLEEGGPSFGVYSAE